MPLHRDSTLENIHRHHRWEVNNQAGLDALVPDALDIHKVAYKKDDDTYHVLKSVSPTIWVQTAYAKAKTDELLGLKQNILTEGAFLDGDKTKLDSVEDGATADQTAEEIKTAYESNADTNALTDTLKALLEAQKVKNVTTDSLNDKLVITYTDNTVANLNINDIVTDVHVSGATLDATTNVLTLTSTDGGADVTVNLSDFVNSSELTTALNTKQDNLVSGTSVKTINGESVLGSGNIVIIDEGSVQLTGNQNVDGVKTFSSSIVGDITGNAATTTKLKTPVKINGIDFDGSVDITIEAGGSGSSTFTGTAAIDIGGVKVGDSWDNAPISDVVNAIINPELFPTFVNPTFSFTSTVNGFREVGSVTDITFNVNFSRGSITPQYSAENNYRSGLPTTYNYSGPVGSEAKANNTLTDTKTITGYSIAIGSNTFFCSVDYSIGTQPKSSKGNNFNTPLPAGALAAKSVTITGVYPVYSGIGTLSKIPLQAHGTAIVVDAPADMNVGGNRFTIHYPNVWSAKTPVIQQENELSKAWDNQNMLEYKIADINISGVPYKQVKYVGSGIGIRKLRLMF